LNKIGLDDIDKRVAQINAIGKF